MFNLFKKITLVLLTVSCCNFIDVSSVRAQNVDLDSFDDVELQQYYFIFRQQREIQLNSSCQVLPENYCNVLILEWDGRQSQLENYMIQRGVDIPEI